MRFFGLTPDQVLARGPAPDAGRTPSLPFSIIYGALGFGLVSVLAYSIWAFRLIRSDAVLFPAVAVVYIALTGLVLGRLVLGAGTTTRFAALFAAAFLVYALFYCAFWFGLRGKYLADLWGSVLGLAAFTFMVSRAFEKRDQFLLLCLVLLLTHSAGYYLGGYFYDTVRDAAGRRSSTGRLLWGGAHGVGFGAGLGFLLFHAQSALRLRLRPANPPSH